MDPLAAKFDALRVRVRRLNLFSGLAWTYSISLLLLLGVCILDWAIHLDPPLSRRIAGLSVLAIALTLLGRLVIRPAFRRFSDLELALQVERVQPGWRGALASAAEFLDAQCRVDHGAARLQQALIDRIRPRLTSLHPELLLDHRRLQVPAALAVLASLATAAMIASDQQRASLLLQRIGTPTTAPAWPRAHTLVLLDERGQRLEPTADQRLAPSGEPLRLYVDDETASLPEEVWLHVRDSRGATHIEPLSRFQTPEPEASSQRRFVAVIPQLDESVEVRVTGGDDQRMPWHAFRFTSRPSIRELRAVLTPPAYTGRPAEITLLESAPIEGLVGTRVRLEVTATEPLSEARFSREGAPPQALPLDSAGLHCSTEFDVLTAGRSACWFELTDRNGLRSQNGPRFEVRGIADREPAVSIESPATDLTVTPQARLPMTVLARDDLGLAEVRLVLSNPPGSAGESIYPLLLPADSVPEALLTTELSIADMSLDPGRIVQVRAEATDACDQGEPHIARSPPRILTLVTPAEKLQELQARQTGIAQSLESALSLQNGAWQQTRELHLQWTTAHELSNQDFDRLKRAIADQQRVSMELLDERRGVSARAGSVITELEWNQLEDAATAQRLDTVQQELDRIRRELLAGLEQSLAHARKALSSEELDNRDDVVESALASAAESQEAVSLSLAMLLDLFQEWQLKFDLHREVASLIETQRQLHQDTLAVGRETVAKLKDALTPQQLASLARLASRQLEAARQLDRLQSELSELTDTDSQDAPATSSEVSQALDLLRSAAPEGDMRMAAEQIDENQVSEAVTAQQSALQTLESLDALVRGIGTAAPEVLLKQIAEAQTEAEELRKRQTDHLQRARELADSTSAAPEELQELRQQQAQLAADAADLARRLIRRQLGDAVASASRAGQSAAEAAAQLQDDVPPAPAAIAAQQDALDDLLQTERELALAREQLEANRALAELGHLASLVETLAARQDRLLEETVRLDAAQREDGALSRSQLRTLNQLADEQSHLSDEVSASAAGLSRAPVVSQVLVETAAAMREAGALLADRTVGDTTQALQRDALERLAGLQQELSAVQQSDAPTAPSGPAPATGPTGVDWASLVQIRLLLKSQEDIAQQTRVLTDRRSAGEELTAEEQSSLADLARRQSQLAELARQVLGETLGAREPETPPVLEEEPRP